MTRILFATALAGALGACGGGGDSGAPEVSVAEIGLYNEITDLRGVKLFPTTAKLALANFDSDGQLPNSGGVSVFSIVDPERPEVLAVAQYPRGNSPTSSYYDVVVSETEESVFAATSGGELQALAFDGSSFVLSGRNSLQCQVLAVALDSTNSTAYSATSCPDLAVNAVSDPQNLNRVGTLQLQDQHFDIEYSLDRQMLFLAGGEVEIVDVSDASAPTRLGRLTGGSQADYLGIATLESATLLATVGGSGISIFDVSIPSQPQLIGSVRTITDVAGSLPAAMLAPAGNRLYAVVGNRFLVVDKSDIAAPRLIGELTLAIFANGTARDLAVSRDERYAYVAAEDGLHVLSIQ